MTIRIAEEYNNNKCTTLTSDLINFSGPHWPKVRPFSGPTANFRTLTGLKFYFSFFRTFQNFAGLVRMLNKTNHNFHTLGNRSSTTVLPGKRQ